MHDKNTLTNSGEHLYSHGRSRVKGCDRFKRKKKKKERDPESQERRHFKKEGIIQQRVYRE